MPKSKLKKQPPLPRLLSKEVTHKCICKSRSSPTQTGRRAFELAQDYSISNSRLALGSALFLGGVLSLNQVQSAGAVDWIVGGDRTFDLGITAVNTGNDALNTIAFAPEIIDVTSSGIAITKALAIDGTTNSGRVIIISSGGTCIIC